MKYLKYLFFIAGRRLADTGLSIQYAVLSIPKMPDYLSSRCRIICPQDTGLPVFKIPDYLSSNSDAKIIIFFRLR